MSMRGLRAGGDGATVSWAMIFSVIGISDTPTGVNKLGPSALNFRCIMSDLASGGHAEQRVFDRSMRIVLFILASCTMVASRPTPKALLINLPKHEERYRTVKEQLVKAEMDFEKADAVDGRKLTLEDQEARVTPLGRALMTPGMIGCFLSHKSCWARCVELAQGPIIVFEDDVVLADNFTASLHAAMDELDELPDGWDVLLLGALGAVHPSYYCTNFLHAMMAGGLRWPRGARKAFYGGSKPVAVHTPLRPFGTHAYVVSEQGAKKLLAAAPRANYHVDVVAWGLRSLKLHAVHPLLAKQTHGDTTIGGASDRFVAHASRVRVCAPPLHSALTDNHAPCVLQVVAP